MKPLTVVLATLMSVAIVHAQGKSKDQRIAETVTPLPTELQAGATVVAFDGEGGRTVLREGTNDLVCRADGPAPGFLALCYHQVFSAHMEPSQWEGMDREEVATSRIAQMNSGKLPTPPHGAVIYTLRGPDFVEARPLVSVFVPNATPETTGLSTEMNHYRPWLMRPGTPWAHIMIAGK